MQGPPGTGKTRTLLALITVMCKIIQHRGRAFTLHFGPILATAGTNAAADNLLEGLAGVPGMRVARVGQPANVREALRPWSLAALAEATPEGAHVSERRCKQRSRCLLTMRTGEQANMLSALRLWSLAALAEATPEGAR